MINNLSDPSIQNYLNCSTKRHEIINNLISKYNHKRYLEIGVYDGLNIKKIIADHKDGVDPGVEGVIPPEVNYPMTSDLFFATLSKDIKYDIVFIDGLHESSQVMKDIKNSFSHLNIDGHIVLHDCNPPNEQMQKVPRETIAWTGDVWKAFVSFRQNNTQINSYTIDTDWGVGIIEYHGETNINFELNDISWEVFDKNRNTLLRLTPTL